MDKLLIVLGVSANDAIQGERLLDLIAIQNNKQPRGHLLLAAAPDLHGETTTKLRIAAEVAFESVELLAVPWPAVAHTSKTEAVNYLFYSAATHAARCYQWPFLWIESDCVPLTNTWTLELEAAYYEQPRRYMGSILASSDGKTRSLSRVAIYPRGAGGELKEFTTGKIPFEMAGASLIIPRAQKTRLIQQLQFTAETERKSIREDAVLLHSDKQAVLLSALIDEASHEQAKASNGIINSTIQTDGNSEPPDKRTKVWREWKARQESITKV